MKSPLFATVTLMDTRSPGFAVVGDAVTSRMAMSWTRSKTVTLIVAKSVRLS